MADERVPTGFRPQRGLGYLGGFFAYGLGLSFLYATTGRGLWCPFRAVTGWNCPLCGATRMGNALLHADPAAAWSANPAVFLGLVSVTVLGVLWAIEVLGGPRLRPPARLTSAASGRSPTFWLVGGLALAVGYTVVRNLS